MIDHRRKSNNNQWRFKLIGNKGSGNSGVERLFWHGRCQMSSQPLCNRQHDVCAIILVNFTCWNHFLIPFFNIALLLYNFVRSPHWLCYEQRGWNFGYSKRILLCVFKQMQCHDLKKKKFNEKWFNLIV